MWSVCVCVGGGKMKEYGVGEGGRCVLEGRGVGCVWEVKEMNLKQSKSSYAKS